MGPLLNGAHIYITISGALIYWAHLSTVYGATFKWGTYLHCNIWGTDLLGTPFYSTATFKWGTYLHYNIWGTDLLGTPFYSIWGHKFFFGAHIYITIYGALIYWAHLPTVYGDTGLSMGNTYTLQYLGHFSSKTFFNFLSKT